MEKINYREHELEWIDGLLAITESARHFFLALKRSRSVKESATEHRLELRETVHIYYSAESTRAKIQPWIDERYRRALETLLIKGS